MFLVKSQNIYVIEQEMIRSYCSALCQNSIQQQTFYCYLLNIINQFHFNQLSFNLFIIIISCHMVYLFICILMYIYQKLLVLSVLLLVCSSFGLRSTPKVKYVKVQPTDDQQAQLPKLPMYLGSSYNLIYGNPKSQYGLDPGFFHPVFNYQYTKQQTTEDGKYLIPNGVSSHKMSSCAFTTDINAFRGTQSYQTDLHKIATLTAGFGGSFVSAAFSLSRSWEKIQNSTIEDKTTITHATAQCQTYQLIIDMFKMPTISDDFQTGAVQCYQKKDWTQFIEQFGSHFVHQIIVGGRATQQTVFSFQSVSKLESLEVDINITAKASFAKFFSDATFDWEKHDRQIQYSQRMQTMRSEQYIGGAPPRTGNIYDWQQKIIESPMPIKYKLLPLTDLFQKVSGLQFDAKKATADFNQALEDYCTKLHCKPAIPDLPKPNPATVLTAKTQQFGQDGGQTFQSIYNSTTLDLKRVHIRSGSSIDNLQLFLSDGVTQLYTPAVGGMGGGQSTWTVPENQFVTQIEYRSGTRIDSLTFITNKGNKSPKWGGNGGGYHLVTFPDGYRIIGFYGVYGNTVYKLGFILGKTMYPVKDMSSSSIIKIQLE